MYTVYIYTICMENPFQNHGHQRVFFLRRLSALLLGLAASESGDPWLHKWEALGLWANGGRMVV